jgi:transposase
MLQIRRFITMLKDGCSQREISRTTAIHRRTIKEYYQRITQIPKSYSELLKLSDGELSELVYPLERVYQPDIRQQWLNERIEYYIKELSRIGVTRQLLWEEYITEQPDGYKYSKFCECLSQYKTKHQATLNLVHLPGDKIEIDFAGHSLYYADITTGELIECPVLVCTLPYSSFSYVEPLISSKQEHLIPALNRALEYIGGVPKTVVSDNMAQVVVKACKYEPVFTELMEQWSLHYQTTLKATRVKKPKDKPTVEKTVHLAYQQIYARLRNETFNNIEELKKRTKVLLGEFNTRPMYKKEMSRIDRFLQEEKPYIRDLPEQAFILKHKAKAKVKKNYHVILGEDWHQYSVPHQYLGQDVELIYDEQVVEIFLNLKRIAVHKRNYRKNDYSTLREHRTEAHQRYLEQKAWTSDDFTSMASRIGINTENVIRIMLSSKYFIEQTYDGCIGILRLADKYGEGRLEAASKRALQGSRVNYRILKNILVNNLDKAPLITQLDLFIPDHENIRGAEAFN